MRTFGISLLFVAIVSAVHLNKATTQFKAQKQLTKDMDTESNKLLGKLSKASGKVKPDPKKKKAGKKVQGKLRKAAGKVKLDPKKKRAGKKVQGKLRKAAGKVKLDPKKKRAGKKASSTRKAADRKAAT
jgi:hypothetical protein